MVKEGENVIFIHKQGGALEQLAKYKGYVWVYLQNTTFKTNLYSQTQTKLLRKALLETDLRSNFIKHAT